MRHIVFAAVLFTLFGLVLFGLTLPMWGQSPTATVNGLVRDPSGAVVPGAEVQLINEQTNTRYPARTNREGIYSVPNLPPGTYRIQVSKVGFKTIVKPDIILNVLDARAINFDLPVGAASETVTVDGGAAMIDPESFSVSTVIDRQFAENLPLNGRSFQSLIQLTPGVVLTANNGFDTGQFSVNGQRANSNYWMVDGVSANIGISASPSPGSGIAGTLGSTSVLGGTNSLVSVDALQELRIETSTYAPEFGRTPGGQISIVTRSGTNQFHGTAFDYFRNDALDANDWFNGFMNNPALPKAKERQNDFGGTFSGPILKNNTFFFFSYEGLRLRLPLTALTYVPDASFTPGTTNSRENAIPALQPYFNAFPLPNRNSPEVLCDPSLDFGCPSSGISGSAAFNASFSNPATLDAYSLRVDHNFNERFNLFGRYNYSPSALTQRGSAALSVVSPITINTQTATLGALWAISSTLANDLRFNYSRTDAFSSSRLDNFGGAVPLGALPFPSPFTARNASLFFSVTTPKGSANLDAGARANNQQRQLNLLDTLSLQKGAHSLRFGMDYRRLSPRYAPTTYSQQALFSDIPSAEAGTANQGASVSFSLPVTLLFRNLGAFAQDAWHIMPRLTMTYGLRWDVDFVPSSLSGPDLLAVTGFDVADLSNLALAPAGTPLYKTNWGDFAPRIGLAYQISQSQSWLTVFRGGFGVFYDLASSEVGTTAGSGYSAYPFGSVAVRQSNFPFSPTDAAPAPILPPSASSPGFLFSFNPRLELPYTLQWNVAVEQALGKQQTMNVSYVGAAGRRLVQTAGISFSNPFDPPYLLYTQLVTNAATADYDALQLQFQRRLSRGLQGLASYSWSHSLDTASGGSVGNVSNALAALNSKINRGASDFDVRNALSIALTYDVPAPQGNPFARAALRGWSTENIIQAQSAPPVNVFYVTFPFLANSQFFTASRPDIVAGQPLYLNGAQYPGGRAINPLAFTSPPLDPVTQLPSRQGDLPRNTLRGFGSAQWDFAAHREFVVHETLKLQFRAELFNVLNHPNFGPPVGDLSGFGPGPFGQPTQMLGKSLNGGFGTGSGGFNPLYQLGGPRSIQLGLKLSF